MSKKLLVFLRGPVIGKVKSRLASELGNTQTLAIYKWLQDVTYKSFVDLDVSVHLYFDSNENFEPVWSNSYSCHIQHGENLEERMINAFKDHIDQKNEAKVIIIGSDCPEMNSETLEEAFYELNSKEVVLGPAKDGGVYLIGLRGDKTNLLNNIDWETEKVFNQLQNKVKLLEHSVLAVKHDIDYADDFELFKAQFDQSKARINHA